MIHLRSFTFSVIFLLFHTVCHAQMTSSEIDGFVEKALKDFKVAGCAVAVVKDGQIIHNKGYGVISSKSNIKTNRHSQFEIASLSKAFTTAALAILVEEGKIKWDDKVVDHIPEFRMYNDYVTQNFNIVDLLTHRSGLGLGIGDLMIFPDGSDFTIDDLLSSFQHFKPVSAFRTQFDYDNLLYIVAGEVIARKSGLSWEQFVSQKIFSPLGMDNSYTSLSEIKDRSNLSSPHTTATGQISVLPNYEDMINGAAGGIYSNVDDLCQWMLCHLNEGKYGTELSDQLFTEKNQREMWKIHTVLDASRNPRYNSHFNGYGLGWALADKVGNMEVSHTGGLPGMLSRLVLIPDLELGVVVLTNTEVGGAGIFEAVSRTIVDSYFGLDDYDWDGKMLKYFSNRADEADSVVTEVWNVVKRSKKNTPQESNYIGVYK
ncbi:MAG: beta-lactamase family protein, partial [Bacteroidia bacterium]|nr:beta-lactamase family protein [Bacteroidia bacterium]